MISRRQHLCQHCSDCLQ